MFCHNCGSQIADGSKFCDKCGAAQQASNVSAPAQTAPRSNPLAANPFAEQFSSESEKKSIVKWVVIGILAVLVLGFIFDMAVLSKASSDYDKAVKQADRQYNRAMDDLDRQMKSIRW